MLRAATNDAELVTLERAGFGVSHNALGAAMCDSWDLDAGVVATVRHHVAVQATRELPDSAPRPTCYALSAFAHALMSPPDSLDEVVHAIAPGAELDPVLVLRAAHNVQAQLAQAASRPLRHAA